MFNNKITKTVLMFNGCKSLINLNLSNFNTEKENVNNMNDMFDGCENLNNIDLSNFNTQNATDICCL